MKLPSRCLHSIRETPSCVQQSAGSLNRSAWLLAVVLGSLVGCEPAVPPTKSWVEAPKSKTTSTKDSDAEIADNAESPADNTSKAKVIEEDSETLPNTLTDDLSGLSIEAFLQYFELSNPTAAQSDDGVLTISFDYIKKLAPPPGRRLNCLVGISRNPPRWIPVDLKEETGRYDLVYGPVFAEPGPKTQLLIELPPIEGNGPRRVSNMLEVTLPSEVKLTALPKRVVDPTKPRAQPAGRQAEQPVLPETKKSDS